VRHRRGTSAAGQPARRWAGGAVGRAAARAVRRAGDRLAAGGNRPPRRGQPATAAHLLRQRRRLYRPALPRPDRAPGWTRSSPWSRLGARLKASLEWLGVSSAHDPAQPADPVDLEGKQYERMGIVFSNGDRELEGRLNQGDIAGAQRVIEALGHEAIVEHSQWL